MKAPLGLLVILATAVIPTLSWAAQAGTRVYRVGMLESVPAESNRPNLDALRKSLAAMGIVEGDNLIIEYRSAGGNAERFPELAAELSRSKVDLIISRGTPATNAARTATSSIPVVMATMGDPRPIVASFARPGGNITGVTTFTTELMGKRVEIMKELIPNLARIALFHNMSNPAAAVEWDQMKAAASALGLQAELFDIRSGQALARAFDTAKQQRVGAIIVGADGLMQMHQKITVDLALTNKIATGYPYLEAVESGGLVAYTINYADLYARMGTLAGRILKGAKPAELPVEQPTKFQLAVNIKTAQRLGLAIPPAVRLRVDKLVD